ncbi:hypothetical protein NOF55_23195 [Rhizobiaceae bacterium BDR2-2]|uniref:Uncharacterized protein n=1 Tax=Ectorhizobium quercum TaxID=2965071 RepID=A0AAE3SX19_9HYPH|nr:hypothetical protein [Ectorhizobium quercum]MCX9000010.1 hypothetical protein [Ectorhizobium quercum]
MHGSIIITCALNAMPAAFQDIFVRPVTTADPGYLFPDDQYQRNRETSGRTESGAGGRATETKLDAAAQARGQKAFQPGHAEAGRIKQRAGRD